MSVNLSATQVAGVIIVATLTKLVIHLCSISSVITCTCIEQSVEVFVYNEYAGSICPMRIAVHSFLELKFSASYGIDTIS